MLGCLVEMWVAGRRSEQNKIPAYNFKDPGKCMCVLINLKHGMKIVMYIGTVKIGGKLKCIFSSDKAF